MSTQSDSKPMLPIGAIGSTAVKKHVYGDQALLKVTKLYIDSDYPDLVAVGYKGMNFFVHKNDLAFVREPESAGG